MATVEFGRSFAKAFLWSADADFDYVARPGHGISVDEAMDLTSNGIAEQKLGRASDARTDLDTGSAMREGEISTDRSDDQNGVTNVFS